MRRDVWWDRRMVSKLLQGKNFTGTNRALHSTRKVAQDPCYSSQKSLLPSIHPCLECQAHDWLGYQTPEAIVHKAPLGAVSVASPVEHEVLLPLGKNWGGTGSGPQARAWSPLG